MEILDIVDENGEPTGEVVEREVAHANDIPHRTSHVWLLRKHHGELEVLLQKRSDNKDSFPGCYDISSAGHIPAGFSFKASALKELKEELGLDATEEELVDCGLIRIHKDAVFHGKLFRDNQISRVFYIVRDVEPEQLILQESEVSEVRWMSLKKCKESVANHTMKHCILPEELAMLPIDI